jgi:hypothetical protein
MKSARLAALLWILACPLGAELTVQATAGHVGVESRAVPLSSVLDLLARHTGMRVVYDGPPPAQLVTVSLSRPALRDLVCELLEGQGLDYGLGGDAKTVKVLVVITQAHRPLERADRGDRAVEERVSDEDGEAGIPLALRPLLPPPPDPATQGIPAPLQALMDERDRSTAPATAAAPAAGVPPALLALTPQR